VPVCRRPSDMTPLKLLPSTLARHATSGSCFGLPLKTALNAFSCLRVMLAEKTRVFVLDCRRPSDLLKLPSSTLAGHTSTVEHV
jgi:hypothetical protein